MKSSFLLLALLGAATAAEAQTAIPAGTVSLGGGIGYSRSSDKYSSTPNNTTYSNESSASQFSFTPAVGYFVADNLEIGLNLGYMSYRKPYNTFSPAPAMVRAELDPTTTLRVGPFVRYYKMISDQFGVSGTLGAGYQSIRDYQYSGNSSSNAILEYKGSGYYAGLTPAIVFFPVPQFAISASIGSLAYSRFSFDYPASPGNTAPSGYENTSSAFGADFGFSQLQFGGTYYFGRK